MTLLEQARQIPSKKKPHGDVDDPERDEVLVAWLMDEVSGTAAAKVLGVSNVAVYAARALQRLMRAGKWELRRVDKDLRDKLDAVEAAELRIRSSAALASNKQAIADHFRNGSWVTRGNQL